MNICFFTDEKAKRFQPLTLTRPMDDLRVGIFTIREKWMHALDTAKFCRILPDQLKKVFKKGEISETSSCVWINSRFLPSGALVKAVKELKEGEQITFKGAIVAVNVKGRESAVMHEANAFSDGERKNKELPEAIHLEHLWDLISLNKYEMDKDLPFTGLKPVTENGLTGDTVVQNPENIFIGEHINIEPGCVFIAKEGPIVIQEGATIEAGSILRGPVAVGENATIKMAARIYGGTTIGPVCKIGGEVSGSIFHSYTNKAHDGFVGNSIFGQWVNLGANTITSNLKNDYKTIQVEDWDSKESEDTGLQFFGTVMGDHSKTAINTMLNTGTICGVSSNIFIDELSPKLIPSFTWLGPGGGAVYRFEKAVQVMEAMMKRREVEITQGYRDMMNNIFANR